MIDGNAPRDTDRGVVTGEVDGGPPLGPQHESDDRAKHGSKGPRAVLGVNGGHRHLGRARKQAGITRTHPLEAWHPRGPLHGGQREAGTERDGPAGIVQIVGVMIVGHQCKVDGTHLLWGHGRPLGLGQTTALRTGWIERGIGDDGQPRVAHHDGGATY